jgi:hypothetical protein
MIRGVVALGLIAALVAGCGNRQDRFAFDGQYFRSSAARVEGDRRQIVISVRPASASLQGAVEAGRYEATRYCIENYGNSAVDWVVGPDQDLGSYRVENDTLVLRGACKG